MIDWLIAVYINVDRYGNRADVKNVIKDQLNIQPFVLVSSEPRATSSQWSVEVTDALSAEYLRESLTVTHDHYKPTSGNLLSRGLDRLFGEVTKGYQVITNLTFHLNVTPQFPGIVASWKVLES